MKGFQNLTSIDEALQIFFEKLKLRKKRASFVSLDSALGRVLAESVKAEEDLPRTDRSAVDGYAVRSEDTVDASQFNPKILAITVEDRVEVGQAKNVWTGQTIPKGANAVIMLENSRLAGSKLEIWTSLTPKENISQRGEDIKRGKVAVEAGIRLKPQHLALIAALGVTKLKVRSRPKIAVLATGNELVEAGNQRKDEQIFEVNRHAISALCQELGAEPIDMGISQDNIEEIRNRIVAGLAMSDAVITTGGTSVGQHDLVPEVVNSISKPGVIVHGIAMRPAMPTALAILNQKPVLIFSGNPVAAIFAFEVFARPLICTMLGLNKLEDRPTVKAIMTKKVTTALGRKTFVRVRVFKKSSDFLAEPISTRGSGVISTMTRSNGYVVVPENQEGLAEGSTVLVHLLDNVEDADERV